METKNIRNIVLAGHGATGKTSTAESMLYTAGVLDTPALVESGKTVSDFIDVELDHQMSIYTSLLHLPWRGKHVNIMDTPGSSDFVGEVVAAFRSSESAIMLISARDGVQIETIKLWRRLNNRNRPRMVFINKMDDDRADFQHAVDTMQENFSLPLVPITIPAGNGDSFSGVVDILHKKWYPVGTAKESAGEEIPSEHMDLVTKYTPLLMEMAADANEKLMDKYLEQETLSDAEIKEGISILFLKNALVPIFAGAALSNTGIAPLLDFITEYSPAPDTLSETVFTKTGEEKEFKITSDDPNSYVFLFKTRVDRFAGKLSYVKVMHGILKPDSELINDREAKKERIGKLFRIQGRELKECNELQAGDIGILAKLRHASTNDTFYSVNAEHLHFRPLKLPQAVYGLAIDAVERKDEDKLGELLQRFTEEDHTFTYQFNSETHEAVISGMGDMHLKLILEQIEKMQNISVNTRLPKVAYRETITKPASSLYRHKKQTGGHGQFAEVALNIKPLARGEHYQFENAIKGGAISRGYIPGVEKGLHEAMLQGIIAAYPVVDVYIQLTDGKEHSVDSSELAFKLAARGAFKDALSKAGPILLEPVMKLSVFISENYLGDILSDMSSRRAHIQGQQLLPGGINEIDAFVPQQELLNYCIELRAITSGTGTFEVEFDHYAIAPQKTVDMVVNERKNVLETQH